MIINSPLNWQVHYEYSRHGLGQDTTAATDPFANILATDSSSGPLQNISTGFTTMTSGFGFGEWAIILIGGYMVLATLLTTRRGVSKVRRTVRRRRKRRQEQIRSYYGL